MGFVRSGGGGDWGSRSPKRPAGGTGDSHTSIIASITRRICGTRLVLFVIAVVPEGGTGTIERRPFGTAAKRALSIGFALGSGRRGR
jgi:hypothetical protein